MGPIRHTANRAILSHLRLIVPIIASQTLARKPIAILKDVDCGLHRVGLTNAQVPYRLIEYIRLMEPIPALPIGCEPFLPTRQGGISWAAAKITSDNRPVTGGYLFGDAIGKLRHRPRNDERTAGQPYAWHLAPAATSQERTGFCHLSRC